MYVGLFEDINTIVSLLAGLLSIIMFFLARNEKNKCIKIRSNIEQKIQILNKESTIKSKDEFNIKKVETFDNRKSIR